MKRILYIDCFSGISGDMMLGAFLSLGLDFSYLEKELQKLDVSGYRVGCREVIECGISAFKFDVTVEDKKTRRDFKDIREIIRKSSLDLEVKEIAIDIFEKLAAAEAKVHGTTIESVHFHEVGAVDSIIDIVGTAISLHKLKIEEVFSREVPLGRGFVKTAHGELPVPAPATVEILKGIPVYQGNFEFEVTTPTGAAIIKTLAAGFGGLPEINPEAIGYGAGSRSIVAHEEKHTQDGKKEHHDGCRNIPNVLRLLMGKAAELKGASPGGTILLSANIDDCTPEILGYVMKKIHDQEIMDAWIESIYMKKNRPAFKLCVLCERRLEDLVSRIIFAETTTLGIRREEVSRYCLERRTEKATLPYGEVEVKIGVYKGKAVNYSPEYETCRVLAEKTGKPLKEIYRDAILFLSRR